MLKAVIFDFDGVITDSEVLHFRAFNTVLKQHGVELTTQEYYKTYLGFSDVDCFRFLIDAGRLGIDQSQIAGLVKQKTTIFEHLAKNEGKLIEGVRDFLAMLSANRIPMCICSGALLPEIEITLEDAALRRYFHTIVSAEQVKKGKPHPEGFLLTLKKLNANRSELIEPKQCVVIEDSNWGLQAAKAAGMHTIAVTNSYDAAQLDADKVVGNLAELTLSDLQQLCA
ncbi:MAG: HAD family phosphatase [Sedimentisphaerales bacterium]|nr:HAD family phosphatase [Sedimentisphaerales bacterium]